MPKRSNHYAVYQSILEPWTRLAVNAPGVVNLRMVALPWLWMTDPLRASHETQRMVTEKHEAWTETMVAISQAPMHLWLDTWTAYWGSQPHNAIGNAMINSSRRMARPSTRRVSANQKRLRKT